MKRAAWYLLAPAVSVALFWRTLFTWFRNDDFALLSLPLVAQDSGLSYALFHPIAQGTIRILSERVFYLVFASVFGIRAGPFHAAMLLTWFATLVFAALIGARLAGNKDQPSLAGGVAAALLWTTSYIMIMPLTWSAIYEVLLCSLFMLAALYGRVRWLDTGQPKWRTLEWAAYLLGFGAQESAIMYPAVAMMYTCCAERRLPSPRKDRDVFAMLIPAAIFGLIHLAIRRPLNSDIYQVAIDARLPQTLWTYVRMALGPGVAHERWIIAPALAGFALWRLWKRDWLPVFCVSWFLLFLAPVVALPNHISDYYLTMPLAGFAWLAGSALVAAWRAGWAFRAVAAAAIGFHLWASVPLIESGTVYFLARTSRMRTLYRGVEAVAAQHPGSVIVLKNLDNDLFQAGVTDNAFLLAGIERTYIAPGEEEALKAREDLGGIARYRISQEECLTLIGNHRARVLEVTSGAPRDVTESYERALRAEFLAVARSFVDVGQPLYAARLGSGWYPIESGFRWAGKVATVQLAGPAAAGEKLRITGYGAPPALESGAVTLRVRANGIELGSGVVSRAGEKFSIEVPLPEKLAGEYAMTVSIEASKTFRPAGDPRDLGMIFGTFSVGNPPR